MSFAPRTLPHQGDFYRLTHPGVGAPETLDSYLPRLKDMLGGTSSDENITPLSPSKNDEHEHLDATEKNSDALLGSEPTVRRMGVGFSPYTTWPAGPCAK